MFNTANNKKLALWLAATALLCFAAAALLLFQIDMKGSNNALQEFTVNEEKTFDAAGVNAIKLDSFSTDIKIITTGDNIVKIHVYGKASVNDEKYKPSPEIKLEGNTVYAASDKNSSQNRKVQLFNFDTNISQREMKMDVYIPSVYSKNLDISTSSGDVSMDDLTLGDFSLNTFSGEVQAGVIKAAKAVLESSSGRLAVKEISADDIKVRSFSGDLNIDNIEAQSSYFDTSSGRGNLGAINSKSFRYVSFSGDIAINVLNSGDSDISSSSGTVNIKDGNIGKAKYKTFSGNITAESSGTVEAYVDTSSGSVLVTGLKGKLTAESFSGDVKAGFTAGTPDVKVKSSSGNVRITLPADASYKLDAHSSSGRFANDFPVQLSSGSDEKKIMGTVGAGEGSITVDTFSGNISITK